MDWKIIGLLAGSVLLLKGKSEETNTWVSPTNTYSERTEATRAQIEATAAALGPSATPAEYLSLGVQMGGSSGQNWLGIAQDGDTAAVYAVFEMGKNFNIYGVSGLPRHTAAQGKEYASAYKNLSHTQRELLNRLIIGYANATRNRT